MARNAICLTGKAVAIKIALHDLCAWLAFCMACLLPVSLQPPLYSPHTISFLFHTHLTVLSLPPFLLSFFFNFLFSVLFASAQISFHTYIHTYTHIRTYNIYTHTYTRIEYRILNFCMWTDYKYSYKWRKIYHLEFTNCIIFRLGKELRLCVASEFNGDILNVDKWPVNYSEN